MWADLAYHMLSCDVTEVLRCAAEGEMQKDCWFVLDDLKVKLAMCNGALLMFNSAEMYHSTVRPDLDPKATPRIGIALHCMKRVRGS